MATITTYQYQCVRFGYGHVDALNALAAQGWKVIQVDTFTDGNYPDCTHTALLELTTAGTQT